MRLLLVAEWGGTSETHNFDEAVVTSADGRKIDKVHSPLVTFLVIMFRMHDEVVWYPYGHQGREQLARDLRELQVTVRT